MDRRVRVTVLAALLLVGGWLRFAAIGFGLPDQFHPDEQFLVPPALDLEQDWNPHCLVLYPAAQIYLLHAVLRSYATIAGRGTNLAEAYAADRQAQAFLIARGVSAAMGTATIPAVYWAAAPAFGPAGALASAAIVAFSNLNIRESKFAKMQVPSGLWLVLAIGMMLRIVSRGRRSDYALAGLFSGLATATYYQAALVVFGVLAAHLEARRRENRPRWGALADSRIYLAAFVTLLTLFCATPYSFLDPAKSVRDYEAVKSCCIPGGHGWRFLVFRMMPDSLGIVLLTFLLLALAWAIFHPKLGTPSLLALAAVYFLSLTVGDPPLMYRYALNPLLVMALLAGVFVTDMIQFASGWLGAGLGVASSAALFALILAPSVVHDVQLDRLLLQPDTRTLARLWIEKHIPQPSLIAGTDYDPIWKHFGKPQLSSVYRLIPMEDFDSLRANGVAWVVSDSLPELARYSPGPSEAEQAALNSEATLVLDINPQKEGGPMPVFDPNDAVYVPFQHISTMKWPGPRIRIWMLKPEAHPTESR